MSGGRSKCAVHEAECAVCHNSIAVGEEIWPILKASPLGAEGETAAEGEAPAAESTEAAARVYLKGAASRTAPEAAELSIDWSVQGSCKMGEQCFYGHDAAHRNTRPRRSKRQSHTKTGIFRRWMIDTFSVEGLARGSGVLDIAGGKGELSFELLNLNRVLSTVIDPRVVITKTFVEKLTKGLYTRSVLNSAYVTCPQPETALAPTHLKTFFNKHTISWFSQVRAAGHTDETNRLFMEAQRAATGKVLVGETSKLQQYQKGVSRHQMSVKSATEIEAAEDGELIDQPASAFALLENCALVAGMHPDGAAEPLLDFALAFEKPFAMVPCCTCSKDFPKRIVDGRLVRSYSDFVDYLIAKDSRIRQANLDMNGKNQVLFMTSEDYKLEKSVSEPLFIKLCLTCVV